MSACRYIYCVYVCTYAYIHMTPVCDVYIRMVGKRINMSRRVRVHVVVIMPSVSVCRVKQHVGRSHMCMRQETHRIESCYTCECAMARELVGIAHV